MGENRFTISQVAEITKLKSHTIRYWEEELQLTIDRNNMGHRSYSDDKIQLFLKIKELKELGYQLKAIKMLLPEGFKKLEELDAQGILQLKDELNMKVSEQEIQNLLVKESKVFNTIVLGGNNVETQKSPTTLPEEDKQEVVTSNSTTDKLLKFQDIMKRLISEAVKENNVEVSQAITESVTDSVVKEMDYLFRIKEEREEERFKKLDETIRDVQKSRQEVAATINPKKKKRRLFKKAK